MTRSVHILPIAARLHHPGGVEQSRRARDEEGRNSPQLPILFGAMLEEAQPDERSMMLALVPVPVRLLLRTVFAWQYRRYIKKVRAA